MKYSIYEIETDAANYKRDDSGGDQMINVTFYGDGKGQEMTLSAGDWQKIIEELPRAVRILTQGEVEDDRQ